MTGGVFVDQGFILGKVHIDFNANGVPGHYQSEAHVYGREGRPCHECGGPVRRIVQGQRATYFCGRCQKR